MSPPNPNIPTYNRPSNELTYHHTDHTIQSIQSIHFSVTLLSYWHIYIGKCNERTRKNQLAEFLLFRVVLIIARNAFIIATINDPSAIDPNELHEALIISFIHSFIHSSCGVIPDCKTKWKMKV